ncbi:MAG: 16S rRNA (cytosine(967)-C(5))-methyltransferase RsmB [Verrucomicrobiota bacterium]
MNGESPREIAVRVMRRHGEGGEYVEKLLENELAGGGLTPPDRGLCQELVYGMVRWKTTLDWLVARKTGDRPQHSVLRLLLHLGLYQLFWLQRIPNHAAVHETVELCKRLGFGAKAGFLNAVLRGYTREREATVRQLADLKQTNPALGHSHPAWLVERWQARWGAAKTAQLLEWNNTPPSIYARLNLLKTDFAGLAVAWRQEGADFLEREWDWTGGNMVFELKSHPPLAQCKSFKNGFFYVQDPGTLLAVNDLDPRPGESILDLCAAPGGKTAYIAQRMDNRGRIAARDNQPERLKLVRENCLRLGITCVDFEDSGPPQLFDRILVDAPCSNTGVMRRRVDLRWRINSGEIDRLRQEQQTLLDEAAPRLKAGGTLVYSTCSLEPEENESVTQDFLERHADFKPEWRRQLLPFADGVDGAYVARMRKSG